MIAAPKRRWFHYSLRTLIVVTVAAVGTGCDNYSRHIHFFDGG
jgi:hypothetical protein